VAVAHRPPPLDRNPVEMVVDLPQCAFAQSARKGRALPDVQSVICCFSGSTSM